MPRLFIDEFQKIINYYYDSTRKIRIDKIKKEILNITDSSKTIEK